MWKLAAGTTKRLSNSLNSNNLIYTVNNNNNNSDQKNVVSPNNKNNNNKTNNNNNHHHHHQQHRKDVIILNNKPSTKSNITLVAINNNDINHMTNLLSHSGISISKINNKISVSSKLNNDINNNNNNSNPLTTPTTTTTTTNTSTINNSNKLISNLTLLNNDINTYKNDSISSSSSSSSSSLASSSSSSSASSKYSTSSSLSSSSSSNSIKQQQQQQQQQLPINSRFNNEFNQLRILGKGGFGIVFKVSNVFDEMEYAVKRIRVNQKIPTKELMEAKAMARLSHPNIVRYYGSWIEEEPITKNSIDHYGETNNNLFENIDSFPSSSNYSSSQSVSLSTTSSSSSTSSSSILPINKNNNNKLNNNNNNKSTYIISNESIDEESSSNGSDKYSLSNYSSNEFTINNNNNKNNKNNKNNNNNSNNNNNIKYSLYIQMEFCKYGTLRNLLNEFNNIKSPTNVVANSISSIISLDIKQCREIIRQILIALKYIHSQGIVHRDLTPDNIFVSQSPLGIKIGDFGLATTIESLTSSNNNNNNKGGLGTFLYSSNEQEKGENYNQKTDLYSVGVIFFEMLSQFKTTMERSTTLSKLKKNLSVFTTSPNLKSSHPNDTDFIDYLIQPFSNRPFSFQIPTFDQDNFPPTINNLLNFKNNINNNNNNNNGCFATE